MTLAEALGVRAGDVVAFIGAGGKTTAMYRVAQEMAAAGLKVLVTTTTKIFPPEGPGVVLMLEDGGGEALASRAAAGLARGSVVAVAAKPLEGGKLQGVPPQAIGALRAVPGARALLVEADGSARKPFKAPAEHEPVIPAETTLLVAVVGAQVLGRPLAGDLAHRPELVARQAGIRMGDLITPEVVAAVLLGEANLRGRPGGARLAALITKVGTPAAREAAGRLAALLRARGAAPVILAELAADPPFVALAP